MYGQHGDDHDKCDPAALIVDAQMHVTSRRDIVVNIVVSGPFMTTCLPIAASAGYNRGDLRTFPLARAGVTGQTASHR